MGPALGCGVGSLSQAKQNLTSLRGSSMQWDIKMRFYSQWQTDPGPDGIHRDDSALPRRPRVPPEFGRRDVGCWCSAGLSSGPAGSNGSSIPFLQSQPKMWPAWGGGGATYGSSTRYWGPWQRKSTKQLKTRANTKRKMLQGILGHSFGALPTHLGVLLIPQKHNPYKL